MNTQAKGDILGLFAPGSGGDTKAESVHTPQTQASGDTMQAAPDAGAQEKKERERAFRALIEGEYKEHFTAYFQETFNRRFKEHKQIKAELERAREIADAASERFGIRGHEELLQAIRADKAQQAPTEAAEPRATDTEAAEPAVALPVPRQRRPAESALGVAHDTMPGAARMTKEERADLARRAARGEYITL